MENGYPKNVRDVYPRRVILSGNDNSFDVYILDIQDNLDYLCSDILQGYKVCTSLFVIIAFSLKKIFLIIIDYSAYAAFGTST